MVCLMVYSAHTVSIEKAPSVSRAEGFEKVSFDLSEAVTTPPRRADVFLVSHAKTLRNNLSAFGAVVTNTKGHKHERTFH